MSKEELENRYQWLGLLGLVVIVIGFFAVFSYIEGKRTEGQPRNVFTTGSDGYLVAESAKMIPVAVDEAAFDKLTHARAVKDETGIRELISSGDVIMVPVNSAVRIIDISIAKSKIRVTDGPQSGKAGWVPYEWIMSAKR